MRNGDMLEFDEKLRIFSVNVKFAQCLSYKTLV